MPSASYTATAALLILISMPALAAPTNQIFVTNERSNDVTIIDADSLEVKDTVKVGTRPRGIDFSPDRKELYVAISADNAIAVLDPATGKKLRMFQAGSDPEAFAVHPNGNIYLSNEDAALASAFDPSNGKQVIEIPVGLEPEGVAISPQGDRLIITSESTNMLHIISVPEHKIISNVLVGSRPRSVSFNKDGTLAYSTSEVSGEVSILDMSTNTIIKTAHLPSEKSKPKDILISRDEKWLFVAGGRSNSVFVLNADTLATIKSIPTGKRVWGLALDRLGKRLFTTNGVSGTVSVIDTESHQVIKTIKVGEFPWGVVVDD